MSEPPWGNETLERADGQQLLVVTVEPHERATVLVVTGEVDLYTVPRFTAALDRTVREQPPVVVVDLTGVEFFGSVGLTALLAAEEQAAGHTEIRVVASTQVTLGPIRLTGIDRLLAIYPSRAAALA